MESLLIAIDPTSKNNHISMESNSSTVGLTLDDRDSSSTNVLINDSLENEAISSINHSVVGGKATRSSGDILSMDPLNSVSASKAHGTEGVDGHTVDLIRRH